MQGRSFRKLLTDGIWGILPGMPIVGVVVVARLLGFFQPFEWQALDVGLRSRPAEATDPHITIVAITEADIQAIGNYPIPSGVLANLLQQINQHQPQVIGLDIFRDLPVEPGHDQFLQTIQSLDNVIVINKILSSQIPPPPGAQESQVGFVDALLDDDGFVRRSLLGATDDQNNYRFSFTLRIAEQYLAKDGLTLENGIRNPTAMRFDQAELTPFRANTGGYVNADAGGEQVLINFRSGPKPFDIVTYQEIQTGSFSPELFTDRAILIGITAQSVKDIVNTSAVDGLNPGLVTGIELQAHAISQIINAALVGRPLLNGWPDWLEYIWIMGWGMLGIILARLKLKPVYYFTSITLLNVGLIGFSYGLLTLSWWVPVIPTTMAFFLNSVALYPSYRTQYELKLRLEDRQQLIERTFDQIHNGPLQKLATILSRVSEDPDLRAPLYGDMQALNQELRGIYEAMQQDSLRADTCLQLDGNVAVQLEQPLHEMLYEVYEHTLERKEFPYFAGIKVHVRTFEPMADQGLPLERKRELGRFLEEALCNVGKYAKGCSRLTVTCGQNDAENVIRVLDNGSAVHKSNPSHQRVGRGTQQAMMLARRLKGTFERTQVSPHGCQNELCWPARQATWQLWK